MNKSHKQKPAAHAVSKPARTAAGASTRSAAPRFTLTPRTARRAAYLVAFLCLFLFLFSGYGDVLSRAEQDSYVSTSPDTMHYLLSRPYGRLCWLMRWPLLLFRWTVVGAAALALVYLATVRLADYALRLPRRWEGAGFVLVAAQWAWMMSRGTNLYYKNEPALFLIIAFAVLVVVAVAALVVWLIIRNRARVAPARVRPYGLVLALALTAAAFGATYTTQVRAAVVTARLQRLCMDQEWEQMIAEARSVARPSRAIAAYHAIALEETDQLLDGVFELTYDYPRLRLDSIDGSEEYGIFLADASYHAGLVNTGYRCAMDQTVMNGPRLYSLKRMAVCALASGEPALARKYLTIIGRVPFERAFCEKYGALAADTALIAHDPEIAHVRSLRPRQLAFEQNFPPPAFLGYNCHLLQGSDATLFTSIAACLYSKDLNIFMPRADVLARKGISFPSCVSQAIAIAALKQPQLLQAFPQVGQYVTAEVKQFLTEAKVVVDRCNAEAAEQGLSRDEAERRKRIAMRQELKKNWAGTYVYYYYTENNEPEQVEKAKSTGGGVN